MDGDGKADLVVEDYSLNKVSILRNTSNNAELSALTLSSGTLDSTFVSTTTAYTASVTNATTGITVTPTKSDANATIQVQLNSGKYSTVISGSASNTLALNVGSNTINVKVTAQDGTTIKTYTITVTRACETITVTQQSNQTVCKTVATAAINFSGTGANNYSWANNNTAIGLAASGTGNIGSFTATNATGSPVTGTITVTPSNIPYAYISNSNSNTVSVVNTVSNAVVATIPVGTYPFGVCVSPDGTKVYVSNVNSNNVSVINTATNTVSATIVVGTTPFGIIFSQDGAKAYIANYNSNNVSVINTATNTVTTSITVGTRPVGLCISTDGGKVYVANSGSNNVSVINTATNTVITSVSVGTYPYGLAVTPDGSSVYVVNNLSANTSVINTATNTVSATIGVGSAPNGVAVSTDGSKVYVSNISSNSVSVINTATNTVSATIAVGNAPNGLSLSPDGTKLYVANSQSGNVSVINTVTNTIASTITVGSGPIALGKFISGSGCTGTPVSFDITVNPANTVTLSSAVGTNAQTVMANTGIANIKYNTTGATGASFSNLPAGVTGSWSADVVTISGTPTAVGTFNYTVTLTGGCGTITANGSLTVNNSSNANLSALAISSGALSPVFDAGTLVYNASVTNATTGITLTPTKADANATIQVRVNSGSYATVTSGSASASLSLNVGSNTVDVKVIAQDGTTLKTYTITVTRVKADQNITFPALSGKNTTSPDFEPGATTDSGLAITYTSSNTNVATVYQDNTDGDKWKIRIQGEGITDIVAAQAGNANYNSASVSRQLIVGNVLPVELINYQAKIQNNKEVLLSWVTSSEFNNAGFEIWKATDGKSFEKLAFIKGAGSSATKQSYSYVDISPNKGDNYYKLIQLDKDGVGKEVGLKSVRFEISKQDLVSVYPNPTRNFVNVDFEATKFTSISISDVSGKVILKRKISSTESKVSLNVEKLPTASYIIKLQGTNGSVAKTFIKL